MSTPENTNRLLSFVSEKFESNELDNESLVQLIELCGNYLNIQTIATYAKANNMSYNGVKKFRKVVIIFRTKYVIENE